MSKHLLITTPHLFYLVIAYSACVPQMYQCDREAIIREAVVLFVSGNKMVVEVVRAVLLWPHRP